MFKIVKKQELNPTVSLIEVEAPYIAKKAEPGQFIILRIDEKGERIPFTIADFDREKGIITVIFQIVGQSTQRLNELNEGDSIQDFVGPLGVASKFDGVKKVAVIGGGLGTAIAYPQAKKLHSMGVEVDMINGFRNKDLIIIEDLCGAACDNLASSIDAHQCNPLILIPCFTIDFLCIRPFDAGTGRLSRLISHFLLLRAGFDVVRYQSLDALCEQSGMAYYDALNACVEGWDRNANNYEPFERYWLTILHNTYEALFQRLESKLPEDSANKMDRIRAYCLRSQGKLTKQDLISAFPDTSVSTIENALHSLIDDGTLRKVGAGRATAYEVAGN